MLDKPRVSKQSTHTRQHNPVRCKIKENKPMLNLDSECKSVKWKYKTETKNKINDDSTYSLRNIMG